MLRFLTAGESHGPALVVIVEGLPAGLAVTVEDIGASSPAAGSAIGRGPRMRFEHDEVELLGGVRHGRTLGSPVAIEIHNTEWPKWDEEMSPAPGATEKPLTQPRPGHADLAGMQKYGFDDARDVLERASAARDRGPRRPPARSPSVLLAELGVEVLSPRRPDGPCPRRRRPSGPRPGDLERVDESAVRCFDPAAEAAMVAEIKAAAKDGDSLGGVVEVLGYGVPVGPRQPRALGPQARRAARAGAHEHPGDEGRRDRRRLRGRRATRERGARPDPLGRRRRRVPA